MSFLSSISTPYDPTHSSALGSFRFDLGSFDVSELSIYFPGEIKPLFTHDLGHSMGDPSNNKESLTLFPTSKISENNNCGREAKRQFSSYFSPVLPKIKPTFCYSKTKPISLESEGGQDVSMSQHSACPSVAENSALLGDRDQCSRNLSEKEKILRETILKNPHFSSQELGNMLGLSGSTIRYYRKKLGCTSELSRKYLPRFSKEQREGVIKYIMANPNKRDSEIANRFNVGRNSVKNYKGEAFRRLWNKHHADELS